MPAFKDKKTGKWYYSTYYHTALGERKRKLKRGYRIKKDAQDAEREFLSELSRKERGEATLEEVLEDKLKSNITVSTARSYRANFRNHMKPFFGETFVNDITPDMVNKFKIRLENDFEAINSARLVYINFRAIINHAQNIYGVDVSALKRVKGIKGQKTLINPIERHIFDEQVEQFDNINYRDISILLYYSGLRVGEALALQWKHINFNTEELLVEQNLDTMTGKVKNIPKTNASNDFVQLPKGLMRMLDERKQAHKKNFKYFNEDYFVFNGMKPIIYGTYKDAFKKVFPNNRVHDLRHSYASYLANNDVQMITLKKMLRHENIQTTVDTYSHLYKRTRRKAVELFD